MPSIAKIALAALSCASAMTLLQASVIPETSHSFEPIVVKEDFVKKHDSEANYQKVAKHVLEKRNGGGIITSCTVPNTLAITFDDGPFEYTDGLLDFLKQQGVRVTFFLNGLSRGDINAYGESVRRAYDEGHQIGLHTWSHADLTTLSEEEIHEEMSRIDDAVRDIIGVRAVFMRPPFGYTNDVSLRYLRNNGYKIVNWSLDTNDWRHPDDVKASMSAYRSALTSAGAYTRGYISLQHDTIESTAERLAPAAVRFAKDHGFRVVPVGECLGISRNNWYRS
ncbi:hypothetical protein BGZ46_009116 [Entomortierella lignicola]|nr:hypothetical protein BGZ46_009116 [Entomortierella lignicola]